MERTASKRPVEKSQKAYERAQKFLAGGVSSDARRMPGTPLFVDHAKGAELWDVDGNRYLDYVIGQGPNIFGHSSEVVVDAVKKQVARGITYAAQHTLEADVAERLCAMVPSAERVRFNTVGSEAVHAAWRLARGHTGRSKILKFEGHYHGWLDPALYSVHPDLGAAGDPRHPATVPGTIGQTPGAETGLVVLPFNDLEAVKELFAEQGEQFAAIVLEPVLCNTGAIEPLPGYLEGLRKVCDEYGAVLIFDEIITGFRLAPGGAQEYLGVTPDLSIFGKAMAGGMQVSALAGKARIMDDISSGKVAHAGTFNSHPVALAAADATLRVLDEQRDRIYPQLFRTGEMLKSGIARIAAEYSVQMLVDGPAPVFQTYFTGEPSVSNYREFAATDRRRMDRLHGALYRRGVNIVPRGLWFLSSAHTEEHVTETLEIFEDVLREDNL